MFVQSVSFYASVTVRQCRRHFCDPFVHVYNVHESVHPSMTFPRYLWVALINLQTSVTNVSCDKDDLIRFWGQRSKVKDFGAKSSF